MQLTNLSKNPSRARGVEVDHALAFAVQTGGVRVEVHVDGKALCITMSREESAKLRGQMLLAEGDAAATTDPFEADDRGFVTFFADGEDAPCECLELRINVDGDDSAENMGAEFTLRCDGELHDGHRSIEEIAHAFPKVAPTLDDWKAGRLYDFEFVLRVARAAYEENR